MLNSKTIEIELQRSEGEYSRLITNIRDAERDLEKYARMKRAAENDFRRAEEQLAIQKRELETVNIKFKDVQDKIAEFKEKEHDYKRKIDGLEKQLKTILNSMTKIRR